MSFQFATCRKLLGPAGFPALARCSPFYLPWRAFPALCFPALLLPYPSPQCKVSSRGTWDTCSCMSSFILIVLARQAPWVVSFPNCRNFCAYRLLTLTSPFPSSSTSTTYISEVLGARDKPVAPLSMLMHSTQLNHANSIHAHQHTNTKVKDIPWDPSQSTGRLVLLCLFRSRTDKYCFQSSTTPCPVTPCPWHLLRAAFSSGPMKAFVDRPHAKLPCRSTR